MNTVGRHLLAEFYGCDGTILDDPEAIRHALHTAVEIIGATVVGEVFHQFAPQGVSGVVVIAESHLSIHTWPESEYVAIDIYTCGALDPMPGCQAIGECLRAEEFRVQVILRGLPGELALERSAPGDLRITEVAPLVRLTRATGAGLPASTPGSAASSD